MIDKKRVLDRFLTYIQIDSPTRDEKAMAEYLMKEMKDLGMEVQMDNAGSNFDSNAGNILGKLKGTESVPTLVFSSHMDTVSPGIGIKPQIKDGVISSDGTTVLGGDDKSGIAAIIEAIDTIVSNDVPHGDIEVLFTISEEDGLLGSKSFDFNQLLAKHAFVLDSGGDVGQAIVQAPAQKKLNATFVGKRAHAGVAPEEGISAISIAAEAITNMNLLRIDEETTANIGMISGGEATNIVADSVTIHAEARSQIDDKLEKQMAHMVQCCEDAAKKFRGDVTIQVVDSYSSYHVPDDAATVAMFKEACKAIGVEPSTTFSGGGSDANIMASKGIEVVNLATGMSKVHTVDEFITVENLENTAALVFQLMKA